MITLFAADTANSAKILIALEELDLPYEAIPVDILAGEQFEPALTDLNPNAKVPVIVDGEDADGAKQVIFESGAILLHLAERNRRLMPVNPTERSEAMQWLMVQISLLGPMMGQFIHFARFAPSGNDYALSRYRAQVGRAVDVVEQRLGGREWFVGKDYSVVDIAYFPWLRALPTFFGPEIWKHYPRVADWTDRIAKRPAVERADAVKAGMAARMTKPDQIQQDKLDRLLSRGAYGRA